MNSQKIGDESNNAGSPSDQKMPENKKDNQVNQASALGCDLTEM